MNRLQLAQAEGQGIPTILRSMREEGCPPPEFEANETKVTCVLPAHPRHALAREYQRIEEAISLGDFERAQKAINYLLERDSMNGRTIQLFAEVQRAMNSAGPVRDFLLNHAGRMASLAPLVLTQLADVLMLAETPSAEDSALARQLYLDASRGRMAEREIRQVAVGLSRAGDDRGAVDFLDAQFREHSDLRANPGLLRIRGNSLIGLAKQCTQTARQRNLPARTKQRAWEDCRGFLNQAEHDLRRAMSLSSDSLLAEGIQRNLDFVEELKRVATPPELRRRSQPRNS